MKWTVALAALTLTLLVSSGCAPANTARKQQPLRVVSRTLQLVDTSRVTDPTPGQPGGEIPGRRLPTRLWYPATGGPYPLVMFSHGVTGTPDQYADLLEGWAAAGFVVAAPTFPLTSLGSPVVLLDVLNQPADVSYVLTQVLALDTKDGDPLHGRIATDRVAVTGHSGGAVTTLGLLSQCCREPRARAAIVLSGTPEGFGNSYATPGIPTLFLHGTADQQIPIDQGRAAYAAAPTPKAMIELVNGSHNGPVQQTFDPAFPTVLATTTDFLRWTLDGDAPALARLRADAAKPGVATMADDKLPR